VFLYFRAPVPWTALARRTIVDTFRDGCPGLAAQLAFYFLLGLFPALLVVLSLLTYLPVDAALGQTIERMQAFMPDEVATLVQRELDTLLQGAHGGLMTFALAGAIWSSSSAMSAVISTLNRAYDIEEWRPWWKTRLIAIALTVALAIFVVAAFALVVGGADLARAVASWVGAGDIFRRVGQVAQWPVAFALVVFAIDLVYHFAPNADTEWVWVSPGSLLATGLWLLTSLGFRLYLQHVGSIGAVYGAIGSVVVLLLWFYLSGLALLIGAELNAEIDRALPSRDDEPQGPARRKKIGPAAEKHAARKAEG
jgi:membrane protein